jgi:hypothetical protein
MERVFTFILSEELDQKELSRLKTAGDSFVKSWTAHDKQLHAAFEIFKDRIVIIRVDEKAHSASGCSIDKLMQFIKSAEKEFRTEMLNRLLVAVKQDAGIRVLHSSGVKELLHSKALSPDSIVYNHAVSNSEELAHWEMPLKESWLKKYLN